MIGAEHSGRSRAKSARRSVSGSLLSRLAMALLATCPLASLAYDGQLHQQLTFLAAKQFNRCAEAEGLLPVTPLQVRYAAKANVRQSDAGWFRRLFRWHYFDRSGATDRSILGIIETRFQRRFIEAVSRLAKEEGDRDRYAELGRIIGFVQDVTAPAHAVPVDTFRLWRFSFGDRFDNFPVDVQRVEAAVADSCAELFSGGLPPDGFMEILNEAAGDTLGSVQAQIPGLPTTWQSFWELDENPEDFGEYGPAGNNFGQKTEFRCGEKERCVLLENDPLYKEFAFERHMTATVSTMRALLLLQLSLSNEIQRG